MGILDRLFKKSAPKSNLFNFSFISGAPGIKAGEYKQQYKGWVYSCVSAIAEDVGSIKIHLQNRNKDGWKNVDNHPAINLLSAVNPFYTSSDLFVETQSFLEIEGDSFWVIFYNARKEPVEIWPLDPTKVVVNTNEAGYVSGYTYTNNNGITKELSVNEVIQFKRFNPNNPNRGVGTIQAAAMAIDIDNYSSEWERNFFFNSAQPNGVLSTETKLTPEDAELLQKQWQAKYGGVSNSNKVAILHSGLKYQQVQLSQKDMDFLEQRRFSRDEILSLFRVPKSVLGITEDVNRANAEASDYIFAKRVIYPRMNFIVDRLNEFFLPLFGLNKNDWRYVFDNPVPEDEDLKIRKYQAGLVSGYYKINEVREKEGLEKVEGGDVIYVSAMLAPLNELSMGPAPVSADGKAVTSKCHHGVKKKIFKVQNRKRRRLIQRQVNKFKPGYKDLIVSFGEIVSKNLRNTKGARIDEKELKALSTVKKEDLFSYFAFANIKSKWIPKLIDFEKKAIRDTYKAGGLNEFADLDLTGDFDLENPRAVDWINTRTMENITTISETLLSDTRDIIASGVEDGLGYIDIANNIVQFVDDQSDWRADRIARTEVHSAYCGGRGEADRQSGLSLLKSWVVMDGGCCDTCEENASAGPIPFDVNFPSGDDLPSAHPNCRCDYNAEVDKDAD